MLLGKKISVVPEETISPQVTWITLVSFYKTMEGLKKRALSGEKLGSLDDVISKLTKKPRLSQKYSALFNMNGFVFLSHGVRRVGNPL